MSIKRAKQEQEDMIDKTYELKNFILLEEESIKKKKTQSIIKKSKTNIQRKEISTVQKKCYKKRTKAV